MTSHYGECALNLDFPATKKLVLFAVASDASWDTRASAPGLPRIKQWASLKGLRDSQVYALIAELVDDGLLVRKEAGRKGRKAVFLVFPHGCCPLHAPLPGYAPLSGAHHDVASGGPDPMAPVDNPAHRQPSASGTAEAEEAQPPAKGPAKGPVQTGPLSSYLATEPLETQQLSYVSDARSREARPQRPRTAELDPRPAPAPPGLRRSPQAQAEWDALRARIGHKPERYGETA